jgi:hypothetical protein
MIRQPTLAAIGILAVLMFTTARAAERKPRRDAKGQLRLVFEEHSPLSDPVEVYRRFFPNKQLTEKQEMDARFDLKRRCLSVMRRSSPTQ